MSNLSHAVAHFLETAGLGHAYRAADEGACFALVMEGDHTVFDTWIGCYDATHRVSVVSSYPLLVPVHQFADAVEYLMRVNVGLILGSFDFDYETGAVRFRTGVDVEGVDDLASLLKNTFYTNIIAADRYFVGLAKVLFSGVDPVDAVALIRDAH